MSDDNRLKFEYYAGVRSIEFKLDGVGGGR